MQTEKSQPQGERIMPETRFIEFLTRGMGFLGLHRRPVIDFFSYLCWKNGSISNISLFMPPTSEKLTGHIGLGLPVSLSVILWQLRNSRTA